MNSEQAQPKPAQSSTMGYYTEHGPFLDPFLNVNPCCCCCGQVSIVSGVKTTATISMGISAGYLIMGCWFAFLALLASDQPFLRGMSAASIPSLELDDSNSQEDGSTDNLMNILLICGLTSLTGGTFRFLSSLYLLKTAEKENKTPAKVWCFITFGFIILVTSVVLAASQKDENLFSSLTLDIFLCLAAVDFCFLLYFLWVIIVWVKDAIDMPGL